MPISENVLSNKNLEFSHPNFSSAEEKRAFLLKLAKEEPEKEIRAIFREASEKLRRFLHGWTEKEVRAEIRKFLEEYFCLKLDDFCEMSAIPKKEFDRVLKLMEKEGLIVDVKFRRQHEAGKHYVPMYEIVK